MGTGVQILTEGDTAEAARYIPWAKNKLTQLRALGLSPLTQTYFVGGGVQVHIRINPAGDKIRIEAPDTCPLIVFSGLLDTFKAVGATPKRYLIDRQLAAEYRDYRLPDNTAWPAKLLSGVHPIRLDTPLVLGLLGDVPPIQTQGIDGDLYTLTNTRNTWRKENASWRLLAQDPLPLTTRLPVEPTVLGDDGVLTIGNSLFKETYERLLPSKFTGIMRQVVQVTLATSAWKSFAPTPGGPPTSAKAPINYKFGNSWGCVKHLGKYYFIQIGVGAVYWVPADYCVHKVKPDGVTEKDAVVLKAAHTSRKVKLGDVEQGQSWGDELGWAFSYDKPEASVVLISELNGYVATRLATMTITFDAVSRNPVGATITYSPLQNIWGPKFMTKPWGKGGYALFNFPEVYPDGSLQSVTADFGFRFLGDPGPPNYRADNVPVYVYYTEKYGRQLWSYYYQLTAGHAYPTTVSPGAEAITWHKFDGTTQASSDFTRVIGNTYGSKTSQGYLDWGFILTGITDGADVSGGETINGESSSFTTIIDAGPITRLVQSSEPQAMFTNVVYSGTPLPVAGVQGPPDTQQWPLGWTGDSTAQVHLLVSTQSTRVTSSTSFLPNLTLSGYDKEVALQYRSWLTPEQITTDVVRYGMSTVSTAGSTPWADYNRGPLGGTSATFRGEAFFNATIKYPNNCNGHPTEVSVSLVRIETQTAGYYADVSGGVRSPIRSLFILPDANPANIARDTYAPGAPFTTCFGAVTHYSSPSVLQVFISTPPGETRVTVRPLDAGGRHVLFSGAEAVSISANSRVTHPAPVSEDTPTLLVMQAAFTPKNRIAPRNGLGNEDVILFELSSAGGVNPTGTVYDIKNQLFGFLGVV